MTYRDVYFKIRLFIFHSSLTEIGIFFPLYSGDEYCKRSVYTWPIQNLIHFCIILLYRKRGGRSIYVIVLAFKIFPDIMLPDIYGRNNFPLTQCLLD